MSQPTITEIVIHFLSEMAPKNLSQHLTPTLTLHNPNLGKGLMITRPQKPASHVKKKNVMSPLLKALNKKSRTLAGSIVIHV